MSGSPSKGVKVANRVEFPTVIAFGKVALLEPVKKVLIEMVDRLVD